MMIARLSSAPALPPHERDLARLLLADPGLNEAEAGICRLAFGSWPLDADRRLELKAARKRPV
jgi:hypothetical protein